MDFKYFGDNYLDLHDVLGKLPKDLLFQLQVPPYSIQKLTGKELAYLYGDILGSLRTTVTEIMVNKLIMNHPNESEKYKKVLKKRGWVFNDDDESRNTAHYL